MLAVKTVRLGSNLRVHDAFLKVRGSRCVAPGLLYWLGREPRLVHSLLELQIDHLGPGMHTGVDARLQRPDGVRTGLVATGNPSCP